MGTLRVGAAFPDPPFTGMADGGGLVIDLMSALAQALGEAVEYLAFEGPDVGGIFDALDTGAYDCVVAGATVTPQRAARVAFAPPYLISGQALAVNTARLPQVHGVPELAGLTIGVQRGDTGVTVAEELVEQGRAGAVRVYERGGIDAALADLGTGGCDAVIKLAPVLTELVKPLAGVEVVQKGLSSEPLAIAVRPAEHQLLSRITVAQAQLEEDGTLQRIRRKWLGNPYADQTLAVH